MSASAIIFYILAALVLTFGILTVFTRKIFRAAVFLLLSLIGIAGIYLLMDMEFVAAIQIIVYVGGIVVLIIFSIFLTQQAGEKLMKQKVWRMSMGSALAIIGFLFTMKIITNHIFQPESTVAIDNSVKTIGIQLLDYQNHGYVFPFEVVSILLLAALIGSIVIAIREKNKV